MLRPHPKDPLHGLTLETIVQALVDYYGWEQLGREVEIRCFKHDPSVKSSLTFLRRTPWARAKVEELYLWMKMEEGDREEEAARVRGWLAEGGEATEEEEEAGSAGGGPSGADAVEGVKQGGEGGAGAGQVEGRIAEVMEGECAHHASAEEA